MLLKYGIKNENEKKKKKHLNKRMWYITNLNENFETKNMVIYFKLFLLIYSILVAYLYYISINL